jgi:uncharacterized SAM-binding protein YcdF (DUF218 family)
MYFLLSKTIGTLLTPSNFIVTLAVTGLVLILCRLPVVGRRLILAAALLLGICGLSPIGTLLLLPLEKRFPAESVLQGAPNGVIVLGGSIDLELSAARGFAVFPTGADRFVAAAELARRYPEIPVIFTGGSSALMGGGAGEADFALDLFERLGLPRDRIFVEGRARNTIENAAFTKAMASPKPGDRWMLVTSAYHMPRSVGVFRTAGFSVMPCPTDWLTAGSFKWFSTDRPLYALRRTDLGAREWMGLVADWIFGRSKELFPSAEPQVQ